MSDSKNDKITESDLEASLKAFQDGVQKSVDDRKSTLAATGGVLLIILIVVFFLLGKRAGKKKSTLVEIRRY